MYSPESLIEFHRRCHASLSKLLEHCDTLTGEELHRRLVGFGGATVHLQVHHLIAAERYWLGVLQGRLDIDEDQEKYPTVRSLMAFREEVYDLMERYLREASPDQLMQPRNMTTWDGRTRLLAPAHVIIRTQVHIYHHQGQILAMCRLLGKPGTGFDYPIE